MTIALNPSLWMLCLCIFLIMWGITALLGPRSKILNIIEGILAIIAGVLGLLGR